MTGYVDAMRSMLAELLGEVVDVVVPCLPPGLPEAAFPAVTRGVDDLIDYQGPSYAQLYLDRLRRFIGRRNVDDALLIEIAELMARRMCYEDPIRIAQSTLAEAGIDRPGVRARGVDYRHRFRLDELVSALPEMIADPVLMSVEFVGWLHKPVTVRFHTTTWFGVRRLKFEAWLRRWRTLSVRYPRERAWVERWLHMIDRSLVKQPEAARAVARTATMIAGHGDGCRQGLADWNLIIDQLVKPTFDGVLVLPDLASAIATARAAALPDPRQAALKRAIAAIRTEATARC